MKFSLTLLILTLIIPSAEKGARYMKLVFLGTPAFWFAPRPSVARAARSQEQKVEATATTLLERATAYSPAGRTEIETNSPRVARFRTSAAGRFAKAGA